MFKETMLGLSFFLLPFIPNILCADTSNIKNPRYQLNQSTRQEQVTQLNKQVKNKQVKHKTFSVEPCFYFLSHAPEDKKDKEIERLYNGMFMNIESWPQTIFTGINLEWYPNESLSFGYNTGFLFPQNLEGKGKVNMIMDKDTLFTYDINANTSFNEFYLGANIKHSLNTKSGKFYLGIGASVMQEQINLNVKVEMFDHPTDEKIAYYDGKREYRGTAFLVDAYLGTEIKITKNFSTDLFLKYTVFGKCKNDLKCLVEDAENMGANISEQKIDDKAGTVYFGAGLKFYP